ncbi:Ubiquitin-conjugating enzyme [Drechslerella dactyloides]|uniref:Ubiquitin-conjugating enzyme n=1 Tax=Drechslerella dactyloides TaxID=74499 RepID=A0AAD6J1G3_DREDA|nr:Ubiquitin-conjugating enzyme [Drechslerella dactyloides]
MFATKRLQKELNNIHKPLPPGISIASTPDFTNWKMDIQVLDNNPLYADQIYRLNFKFSQSYPIEAPEVTFIKEEGRDIPMHPHIYSNGVICLDLLGSNWSPVQNVESVCMSIQSMLTSNTKNERPPGDDAFVRSGYRSPRNINFVYDDNTV